MLLIKLLQRMSRAAATVDIQKPETLCGSGLQEPEIKTSKLIFKLQTMTCLPSKYIMIDVRVKDEVENGGSKGVLEAMSSVIFNVKVGELTQHSKIYSTRMPTNNRSKPTSSEHEVEDVNAISEADGTCHKEKVNELSSTPAPLKQEFEGFRLLNDPENRSLQVLLMRNSDCNQDVHLTCLTL